MTNMNKEQNKTKKTNNFVWQIKNPIIHRVSNTWDNMQGQKRRQKAAQLELQSSEHFTGLIKSKHGTAMKVTLQHHSS